MSKWTKKDTAKYWIDNERLRKREYGFYYPITPAKKYKDNKIAYKKMYKEKRELDQRLEYLII